MLLLHFTNRKEIVIEEKEVASIHGIMCVFTSNLAV